MVLYFHTKERDKILFINSFSPEQEQAVKKYSQIVGKKIKPILLADRKKVFKDWVNDVKNLTVLRVNFNSEESIQSCLKPIADEVITATCLGEGNVTLLRKVIPFLPNCILPTDASLEWATEKIKMRRILRNYDKTISPNSLVAHDDSAQTIAKIEKTIGYPLIVKPSGLTASLLVSICYHREELEQVLKVTIKKISSLYKAKKGRGEPKLIVEEFMEGDMYSIDAYVNARGVIYFAPIVYVKTGRDAGFDDFFGYMRMTPPQLNAAHTEDAQETATKGIKALGLRSTSCHIEVLRTEKGWKVIEIGPRLGGFRHEMYELSYGIDHTLNDILIRIPLKPILARKAKGYSAVLQFYAKTEGKLVKIQGLPIIEALKSLQRLNIRKVAGDRCKFANNGGDPVLETVLFDPDRSNVLADIRRIEQNLNIVTG